MSCPSFLAHLLNEDMLNGLKQVWLAHRVGAADPQPAPGAVPGRVHLAFGSYGKKSLLTTNQLK